MRGKIIAATLALLLALVPTLALADENYDELNLDQELPAAIQVVSIDSNSIPAKSAILIDQGSGEVLYEQNPDEPLAPASVTKIMTLLLVMESIDSGKIALTDTVVTSENAASMGGSQIWLMVGEQMTVDQLLKAVAISSANDASVALGEHIAGSEEAFVDMMNQRAAQLGMENTHFLNCTGLDEEGHVTTARDIAIMSRELIKYPLISEYSTVWMDSLRDGATELVNTNRLVRFYKGATGLKTGTTSNAGSCLSATATRDGLSLVAVVMGCNTSDERFAGARGLLDYGFANYMSMTPPPVDDQLVPVKVLRGTQPHVLPVYDPPSSIVVEKISEESITQQVTLAEDVQAPIEAGQVLGMVEVLVDGKVVGSYPLKAAASVEAMTFPNAFKALTHSLLKMNTTPAEVPPLDYPRIAESSEPESAASFSFEFNYLNDLAVMGNTTDSASEDALSATYAQDGEEDAQETVTVAEAENIDEDADAEDAYADDETVTVAEAENEDAWEEDWE